MDAILRRIQELVDLPYEQMLQESIVEHEPELLDLNRQQLDQGLDSEGNDLGTYKNIRYKGRYRPVDLDKTGAFRASFNLEPFGQGFEVRASDLKTEKLQAQYGKAILGIPKGRIEEVCQIVKPTFQEKVRRAAQ